MFKPIRLKRLTPKGDEVTERGLLISYPGLVVMAILGLLICLVAGGYLRSRFTRSHNQISNLREALVDQAGQVRQFHQTYRDLLAQMPTQLDQRTVATDDQAYLAHHGNTARQHIEAARFFAAGRWSEALDLCRDLLKDEALADPTRRDLYVKAAWCEHHLGRADAAMALLDEAIEQTGADPAVAHLRADMLLMGGDAKQAMAILEALADDPVAPPIAFSLANAHRALGRTDQAIAYLRLVLAHGQRDLERAAVNNLALIYAEDLRDFDRAELHLAMLLALAPEHPTSLATAGRIMLIKGDHDRAIHFLRRAEQLAPDSPDIRLHLQAAAERHNQ